MSAYRDQFAKFAGADAQVLGISTDDLETQKKFAASLKLPFPLLADPGGKVAKRYGVSKVGVFADRVTFVIGKDGKVAKVLEGSDAMDPAGSLSACPLPGRRETL
jgi:peroxiredoxin Q/BCP